MKRDSPPSAGLPGQEAVDIVRSGRLAAAPEAGCRVFLLEDSQLTIR
jgi:hypothetical protein